MEKVGKKGNRYEPYDSEYKIYFKQLMSEVVNKTMTFVLLVMCIMMGNLIIYRGWQGVEENIEYIKKIGNECNNSELFDVYESSKQRIVEKVYAIGGQNCPHEHGPRKICFLYIFEQMFTKVNVSIPQVPSYT